VTRSNQVWVSDITYIKLRRGMLYKVAIMDIFSRKILGYRISNSLNKAFCVELLEDTIAKYGIPEIFNTDQGSQFTSDEFTNILKIHGVKISMDGKGRALDNIFIERYWKSYKYESVFLHNYFSVFDAKLKIGYKFAIDFLLTLYFVNAKIKLNKILARSKSWNHKNKKRKMYKII
jgi:putative transposase